MINSIPEALHFVPPQFNFKQEPFSSQKQIVQQYEPSQFSASDKQHLKNAFRYITRLIFKQSTNFYTIIKQIAETLGIMNFDRDMCQKLFEKAEEISGERYFRKYLSQYEEMQQQIICQYMHWFLVNKYLNYLGIQGKGKRRYMKKELYIKFKNEVMLPYLDSFLHE